MNIIATTDSTRMVFFFVLLFIIFIYYFYDSETDTPTIVVYYIVLQYFSDIVTSLLIPICLFFSFGRNVFIIYNIVCILLVVLSFVWFVDRTHHS